MIIAVMLNTVWFDALVRERFVSDMHHYEAAIAARSCIERVFFWSENNLTPNITGCQLMSYGEVSNVKTAKVQVTGKDFYVQEIYSVAR